MLSLLTGLKHFVATDGRSHTNIVNLGTMTRRRGPLLPDGLSALGAASVQYLDTFLVVAGGGHRNIFKYEEERWRWVQVGHEISQFRRELTAVVLTEKLHKAICS